MEFSSTLRGLLPVYRPYETACRVKQRVQKDNPQDRLRPKGMSKREDTLIDRTRLNKKTGLRRDFCSRKLEVLLAGLDQRADALGTQKLTNHFVALCDTDRLQVGVEGSLGSFL